MVAELKQERGRGWAMLVCGQSGPTGGGGGDPTLTFAVLWKRKVGRPVLGGRRLTGLWGEGKKEIA